MLFRESQPWYVDRGAWKGYEDVTIVSQDGVHIEVNSCVLASVSAMCRQVLTSLDNCDDGHFCLLTELTGKELIKLYTFITTGHIYSHASVDEVIRDDSIAKAFSTFGISLDTLGLVQVEQGEDWKDVIALEQVKKSSKKCVKLVKTNEAENLEIRPTGHSAQYITKCQVLKEWNSTRERFLRTKFSRVKFLKRLFIKHFGEEVDYKPSIWQVLEQKLKTLCDTLPGKVKKDYKNVSENDVFFSIRRDEEEQSTPQIKEEKDDDLTPLISVHLDPLESVPVQNTVTSKPKRRRSRTKPKIKQQSIESDDEFSPLESSELPPPEGNTIKSTKTEPKKATSEPIRCFSCGHQGNNKSQMSDHLRMAGPHHDGKCRICPDFEAKTWTENEKHLKEKHEGNIQYKCGHCPERNWFDSYTQLRYHRYNCSAWKAWKEEKHQTDLKVCDHCGKEIRAISFKYHMNLKHGTHEIPCTHPGCKVIIRHPEVVKVHMKIHETRICNVCGHVTPVNRMPRHMKTHSEEKLKAFFCDICKKGFVMRNKYDDHMNVHAGRKPHQCQQCPSAFASNSNLHVHVRTVHKGIKRARKSK